LQQDDSLPLVGLLSKIVRYSHDPGLHEASASNDGVTLWALNGEFRMPYSRGFARLTGHEADSLVADITHLWHLWKFRGFARSASESITSV
jgi:hypothetical protein